MCIINNENSGWWGRTTQQQPASLRFALYVLDFLDHPNKVNEYVSPEFWNLAAQDYACVIKPNAQYEIQLIVVLSVGSGECGLLRWHEKWATVDARNGGASNWAISLWYVPSFPLFLGFSHTPKREELAMRHTTTATLLISIVSVVIYRKDAFWYIQIWNNLNS